MNYDEYLAFYRLPRSKATHNDWLYNEWHHGRAYQHEGEFYSVGTGEKLSSVDVPQINYEKLKEYLENELIMEFTSPEECRQYFNTYDGQHFQTVEEMKLYQDPYGFGLDGKWYHISFDEALDVWDKPSLCKLIQIAKSTNNKKAFYQDEHKQQERLSRNK